jgi:formamidopyrimidine-DNA glycosylase
MPELPEVETVRRGLAAVLDGRRLARVQAFRPDLRLPLPVDFGQVLSGKRVRAVGRRAKYLVISVEDGPVLLGHLGMSGRMVIAPAHDEPLGKHDHVRFVTEDGVFVTYTDPRRFGLFVFAPADDPESHPLLAGLGPEPLSEAFGPAVLIRAFKERITPVKVALLDQRVVAGIGNIYASEALFRAGISPLRAAGSLKRREIEALVPAIKAVLDEAIAAGGSSLRDHVQPSGELGYFQHRFAVYDREGEACPGCDCDRARGGGIRRLVQGGRSTFYCSQRQR